MKILIVDDDFQNREIIRARLEQAGFEVAEAVNGDEGLETAVKENADLIILDIMMPQKDGWQVCKAVKANPRLKHVPVIVLTACIQGIDELRSWESGADEFISKPADPALLLESIERLLKGGETHAANAVPKS